MRATSLLWALVLTTGCGWFQPPVRCELSSTSCDGDAIRICVPDPSKRTSDGVPATRWDVLSHCADDPVLGPQTCSDISGAATCVQATPDGGVATAEDFVEGHYLRVRVVEGEITSASDTYLEGRPMSAASGQWAVVARSGDRAVDAALVRDGEDAWVWADEVSRLELMEADGSVRSTLVLGRHKARGVIAQALSSDLPPVVRVAGRNEYERVPIEVSSVFGNGLRIVEPPPALLKRVGEALKQVSVTAASAAGRVVFVVSEDDPEEGVAEEVDGGIEMTQEEEAAEELLDVRVHYANAALWIDASEMRLELLEASSEEQLLFARDLIRQLGKAVVFATKANLGLEQATARSTKLPDDFPDEVAELIKARILPLLESGEDIESTWRALHAAIVRAGLAISYHPDAASSEDKYAVTEGFASAWGRVGASEDFADHLALLAVPEAFAVNACAGFDAPLAELEVEKMTTLAKVFAVYGLGMVRRSALVACIGEVDAGLEAPGMVVHKPSGESVTFASDPQALRTPYYAGATRWAATVNRDDGGEVALLQLVYRGPLPELVRLRTVAGVGTGRGTERQSGALSISTLRDGEVGTTGGGLLLVHRATRLRFEGFIVGAVLEGEALGADLLPLVLFRFDEPYWQEGGL